MSKRKPPSNQKPTAIHELDIPKKPPAPFGAQAGKLLGEPWKKRTSKAC